MRSTAILAPFVAVLALALAAPAPALALEDAGGAGWQLEQPPPPEPPPGVKGSSTPIPLGHIGDVEFWAPNRGLLITAGNGSTIKPGVWAYNGSTWHVLSTVCGASDGRIIWAGPDEFWTISDGRAGQTSEALGNQPPLEDNTLCHFQGGRVVGSYATLAFRANSYQAMHAGGCITPSDCWFAGASLPAPQTGSFHLHWDGSTMTEQPDEQEGYAVESMGAFQGALVEGVSLLAPLEEAAAPLHQVNPSGITPTFEPLGGLPLYAPGEFPTALGPLRLAFDGSALWAAAGSVPEPPHGSVEGQVTVLRNQGSGWTQLVGPRTTPTGAQRFGTDVVRGVASEPGGESTWLALDTREDALSPRPSAPALVTRVFANGSVSAEDTQALPAGSTGGNKGGAGPIACPAPNDCWLASTQGWLFHLTTGSEGLPIDGDPAFLGPITERPLDEGVPQVQPTTLPPDTSGLPGEAPPLTSTLPESVVPKTSVTLPLLSHVHSRIVRGTTLELSFHLAVRARIKLVARRHRSVVASTRTRTLKAGNRSLTLVLDARRWPTSLQLQTHALAPLPTASLNAPSTQTVGTIFTILPRVPSFARTVP